MATPEDGSGHLPDAAFNNEPALDAHDHLGDYHPTDGPNPAHDHASLTDHHDAHLGDHDRMLHAHHALGAAQSLTDAGIVDGRKGIIGTPVHDKDRHQGHQTTAFTCDVMAQLGIFECMTGIHVPEAHGATDAAANGFLTSAGTLPEHMSKLLEMYNVPCHENRNGTFLDVIKELRDGHKVIVGVHADGLWGSDHHLQAFASQHADHAIWLTGVDARDPHHVKVVINDSGTENGGGKVYDLHELEDVLHCPAFHYVATDASAPDLPDRPEGYDEEHHVFSGLDEFLHEHGMAVTVAGAVSVAASACLVMNRLNRRSGGREPEEPARFVAQPAIGCDQVFQVRRARSRQADDDDRPIDLHRLNFGMCV